MCAYTKYAPTNFLTLQYIFHNHLSFQRYSVDPQASVWVRLNKQNLLPLQDKPKSFHFYMSNIKFVTEVCRIYVWK
jgi:hypothetical protein